MSRNRNSKAAEPEAIPDSTADAAATPGLAAVEVEAERGLNAVVQSVKAGAEAAEQAANRFGAGFRKVAYRGVYYVSFGATFGALVAARLVPQGSWVGDAIADGASAARQAFREQAARRVEEDMTQAPNPA